MTQGIVTHLLVALVGMFLSGNTTIGGLGVGLIAGFALMALFRQALGCQDYIRRVLAAGVFAGRFLQQILISNMRIARVALRRDAGKLRGEFLTCSIEGLTPFETLLYCQCISLTPGTIVAEQSADHRTLVLHSFASGTPDEIRQALEEGLKRDILSFTR